MENEESTYHHTYMELLCELEQIIIDLTKENLELSVEKIINLFDFDLPYTLNSIISNIIYYVFSSQRNTYEIHFNLLELIQTKEEDINTHYPKIIDIFKKCIYNINKQESYYFMGKMIDKNLVDLDFIKKKYTHSRSFVPAKYFFPYSEEAENKIKEKQNQTFNNIDFSSENGGFRNPAKKYFYDNYEELSKNDWELHKQLIKEGHNPNEIAQIIRNDEIEKLQEISSQTNFDYNQTIEPSLYERCDFINRYNVTLIDYSAFFGSIKCFKHLLMNGSNLDNVGKAAIAGGNLEIIHLCEQKHLSFDGSFEAAIKFHRNDIFKYLYENKIDQINKSEGYSNLSLVFNDDIDDYNINYSLPCDEMFYYSLSILCIICGNYQVYSFLEGDGKVDKNFFVIAAKMGNLIIIKHFLQNNPIPKDILVFSSESGNLELVQYILEQEGIDINAINKHGFSALIYASRKGYTEIAKLLLEQKGIDINAKTDGGWTALMLASWKGYTEIVKLLLAKKDIKINDQNGGQTALMKASENGHTEIVELLLEQKGININSKDDCYKRTALMKASSNGHIKIVKLLLEQKGININAKDKDGNTILMLSSENGHVEIVKLLLNQEGININIKNKKGETALILASSNGHAEIVKLLLNQEGININVKDVWSKTAINHANENGNTEIVQLINEKQKNE